MTTYNDNEVYHGDALSVLKSFDNNSIDMVFTSPSPNTFGLFQVIDEIWRVLKHEGSLWIEMGDYPDPQGNLSLAPERFAIKMLDNFNWHIKSKPIWVRTETPTYYNSFLKFTHDWEYLFWFTKNISNSHYFFKSSDETIISSIVSAPYTPPRQDVFESGFPEKPIRMAIYRTCPVDGVVLDPFAGSGITGQVAHSMGRNFIMIDNDISCYIGMKERFKDIL